MTHIQNIPHVLKFGITHKDSTNRNPDFVSIGDSSIISKRKSLVLPNLRKLGDYVPFYFGYRMPMLLVIQNGYSGVKATSPENIVYCISSIELILSHGLDFVFTDGHALTQLSLLNVKLPIDVPDINSILDFEAINSRNWIREDDTDLKRRKEAEFLVYGDIPVSAIRGYAVYNESARNELINYGVSEDKVVIRQGYYF